MKALIIAAAFFIAAYAIEASGQESIPKAQVKVEAAPVAEAAPADAKSATAVQAPKPPPAPMPIIMFERKAIPVRIHTVRVDGTLDCNVREPGVLTCTALRSRPAPAKK